MKNKFKASLKIKCSEFLKDGKPKTTLFDNRKIHFKPEKEIDKIDIFLKEEKFLNAREEAIKIAQRLNNLYLFKTDSFLINEEINGENKIIDLERNKLMLIASKSLRIGWVIENKEGSESMKGVLKLNFLEEYEKVKEKERLDKLLSVFGDAERVHDKEIKFLCLYKVINEFGKKSHGEIDNWLYKKFGLEKNFERENKNNGKMIKRTRPVFLRDAIMYDENPDVTEKDLNGMKKYARIYIQGEFNL